MYLRKNIVFAGFIYMLAIISLGSCGNDTSENVTNINPAEYKDPLINANHNLVRNEDQQIEDYIARYQWNMTKTGTGLRYLIYKKGSGLKAEKGMTAQIRFKANLINGVVVFDSKNDGMKSFLLGNKEVESGLEEGIMLMNVGDKAKIIIPSHLAFGLLGDDDKIPKRATLIYDVELVELY